MPLIELYTTIHAPAGRCFNLARSIGFHVKTTSKTGEKAIAGVTSGLIGLDETVTWRARHFGILQTLTSRITQFDYPRSFTDEMEKGAFKSIQHVHSFRETGGITIMQDLFRYELPLGPAGYLFDLFLLRRHLLNLLLERNNQLKQAAESTEWKSFLNDKP